MIEWEDERMLDDQPGDGVPISEWVAEAEDHLRETALRFHDLARRHGWSYDEAKRRVQKTAEILGVTLEEAFQIAEESKP